MKALIFFILFLFLFIGTVSAIEWTVCSSGCDSTTIQSAINGASNYDTVLINNSDTYNENIELNITGLNLTSNSSSYPTINGTVTTAFGSVFNVTKNDTSVSNINIHYNKTSFDVCAFRLGYSLSGAKIYAENVTIENISVYSMSKSSLTNRYSCGIRLDRAINFSFYNVNITTIGNGNVGMYVGSNSFNGNVTNVTINTTGTVVSGPTCTLGIEPYGIYNYNADNITYKNDTIHVLHSIGIHIEYGSSNISMDVTNTINGLPIYFYDSINSIIFQNHNDDFGGLILLKSNNSVIENNNISNGFIQFTSTTNTTITYNNFSSPRSFSILPIMSETYNISHNNFIVDSGDPSIILIDDGTTRFINSSISNNYFDVKKGISLCAYFSGGIKKNISIVENNWNVTSNSSYFDGSFQVRTGSTANVNFSTNNFTGGIDGTWIYEGDGSGNNTYHDINAECGRVHTSAVNACFFDEGGNAGNIYYNMNISSLSGSDDVGGISFWNLNQKDYGRLFYNSNITVNKTNAITFYSGTSNNLHNVTMTDINMILYNDSNGTVFGLGVDNVTMINSSIIRDGNIIRGGDIVLTNRIFTTQYDTFESNHLTRFYIINTSYNKSNIRIDYNMNGSVFNQYYLRLKVIDSSGNALNNTQVTINDTDTYANSDNPTSNFSYTTSSDGYIPQLTLTEFLANYTYNATNGGYLYFSNYTITTSKDGYTTSSQTLNMTSSQNIVLTMLYSDVNVSYDYYAISNNNAYSTGKTIETTSYNSLLLLGVGLIIIAASVIIGYFGMGRKK